VVWCVYRCSSHLQLVPVVLFVTSTATTYIVTLSLHDALPILWLQLRSKPTGEAKDSRQSLLSVDSFSYLVFVDTVLGKSSVSDRVCRHSLLLPIRTSSLPKAISCIGVPASLDRVRYCSSNPCLSPVPMMSSSVRRSSFTKPLSLIIRSNCATASINFRTVSLSLISFGIRTPLQSDEKLLCIRIRSLVVLVRNR